MPQPSINKGFIKYITAFAVFIILTLIYFTPVLDGKILKTNDTTVFRATAKEIIDFREETGTEPLWTNSMFGGMPAYLITTLYPGNIIKQFYNILRKPGIPVAPIILLMAGFYLLLLAYRVDPWLAIAGAIAYGLSSYFFILLAAGHNTKAMALSFIAPLIGSIIYSYRKDMIIGAVLTALILSFEIIANHLQITYYALMIVIAFAISEFIHSYKSRQLPGFFRTSLLLVGAAIIAVMVNFGSLYTTYEYGKFSIRGPSELSSNLEDKTAGLDRSYATNWSYGIDETLTLLIPNLKGGATKPFPSDSETVKVLRQNNAAQYINQFYQYWGTQPNTSGPVYVGAVIFLLFITALILVRDRDKWWMLVITVIAIMLAWGKNFMPFTNLFMDFMPGYNKFRAVTTILIIAEFCMPLLAIIVLDRIFRNQIKKKDLFKALKISGSITGGVLLLFILFPGTAGSFIAPHETDLPDWITSALITDRREMLKMDAMRSLFFVLAALTVIYFTAKGKLHTKYAIAAIALLIIIDMWPVNKRYLNNDNFVRKSEFNRDLQATAADQYILQDKSVHRVLNLTVSPFNDGRTSFHHHSIGGYHGAKLRRYQDLIEHSISQEISTLAARANEPGNQLNEEILFEGLNALNMLNTKYIIVNPDTPPLTNPDALGNCWFVSSVIAADNPDQELEMVSQIDPATEAVADIKFKEEIDKAVQITDSMAVIDLVSYEPNELIYSSSSETAQTAVFSEIYYPAGWNAYIDGEPHTHFRVNYLLRALNIPPGDHEIVFRFEPQSYRTGNIVSFAGSVILLLIITATIVYYVRRKKITEG
jgi:hypothetical protein